MRNVFRGDRVNREIDEELAAHVAEAIEHGRDPAEARRALGSGLRHRDTSRDIKLVAWLDALRADAIFGWRQLRKNPVSTAAAVLSLGIGIGACTSAFRLIDALLLRPLPVTAPEQLSVVSRHERDVDGVPRSYDGCEYPLFTRMRAAVQGDAELLAISMAARTDLTYGSDQEMETAYRQFVSGSMFRSFGLQPAAGRLLTEDDDRTPGAHPYAVISYDYWTRRFGQDPGAIGRTFRIGHDLFEIVGVVRPPFTGTEPGTMTDVFVPTMMHPAVERDDSTWLRTWVRLRPGAGPGAGLDAVHDRLYAALRSFNAARVKTFVGAPRLSIERRLAETLTLDPASAGVSLLQQDNRRALWALGLLVALVLLIACVNVANLLTAQASARAREMALRVSIGAGRRRLIQLVLVESAWLALLATIVGTLFAWWAAPFVVGSINPPDNPARVALPADWRVLGFGLALAIGVTGLFGLAPALRASAVRPIGALKGGGDPHTWRRVMHALIAAQVAFCVVVHLVSGLFVATFERLSRQPTGFSAERLLVLDTVTSSPQPPAFWEQVGSQLRAAPGVEAIALSGWALMDNTAWNGSISIDGGPPSPSWVFFLAVSPGWLDTMRIPIVAGRDFRPTDTQPGVAIVNETFARQYFGGQNPVGRFFDKAQRDGQNGRIEIVGLAKDARYRSMREAILPIAYFPLSSTAANGTLQPRSSGTFIVRAAGADPLPLAPLLRQQVSQARSEFRVRNIRTQEELNQAQTVRERLLAMLAWFFGVVALLLTAVGLYGVLHYSVLQRRREIGIRLALGARAGHVARGVTMGMLGMVVAGAIAGLALGLASERYLAALLYQVDAAEPLMLARPALMILGAAILAALPAVVHAIRIDPVKTLRAD
jgi:predicted permease